MKPWAEIRGGRARREAVRAALHATEGNLTHAAGLLGLSRRHLTRLVAETVDVGETRSASRALTAHEASPTFQIVRARTKARSNGPREHAEKISFELPARLKRWLEQEALRRKHARGGGRMAIGPIVAELIEQAMARERHEGQPC
jgi:hypothetical protein